jgi:hypothetical protein
VSGSDGAVVEAFIDGASPSVVVVDGAFMHPFLCCPEPELMTGVEVEDVWVC